MNHLLIFILGAVLGATLGMFTMALLSTNKEKIPQSKPRRK